MNSNKNIIFFDVKASGGGFLHLADRGLVFDCFSNKQQSARVMETFDVYF